MIYKQYFYLAYEITSIKQLYLLLQTNSYIWLVSLSHRFIVQVLFYILNAFDLVKYIQSQTYTPDNSGLTAKAKVNAAGERYRG